MQIIIFINIRGILSIAMASDEEINRQMKQAKEYGKRMSISDLETVIKNMHKEHPDAIILTQTSAVPIGWAIKEAWKMAYPGEKVPKMLTIDVGQLKYSRDIYTAIFARPDFDESDFWKDADLLKKDPEFCKEVKCLEDKIRRYRIKKFVVFDEATSVSGQRDYHGMRPRATLFLVDMVVSKAHEDLEGSFESGKMYGLDDWNRGEDLLPEGGSGPYVKAVFVNDAPAEKRWRHTRLSKKFNPKVKKAAESMKDMGRKIGADIYLQEKRKRTALESIAIILLLGLGIAYQMPITGYAVKSLVVAPRQGYSLVALIATSCMLIFGILYFEGSSRNR